MMVLPPPPPPSLSPSLSSFVIRRQCSHSRPISMPRDIVSSTLTSQSQTRSAIHFTTLLHSNCIKLYPACPNIVLYFSGIKPDLITGQTGFCNTLSQVCMYKYSHEKISPNPAQLAFFTSTFLQNKMSVSVTMTTAGRLYRELPWQRGARCK